MFQYIYLFFGKTGDLSIQRHARVTLNMEQWVQKPKSGAIRLINQYVVGCSFSIIVLQANQLAIQLNEFSFIVSQITEKKQ